MVNYLNTEFDFNSEELLEVLDELPIWSAPFGLILLENIKYRKNIAALDIGFGAGFPLTEIAMRLGESSKVYGIDPWEAAIRRTMKKIDFYKIKNIEILHGFSENIMIDDNSIDLITSNNGLNNVSHIEKSLSECSRVLKKDGQFIQTLNLDGTMIEFYSIMENVLTDLNMNSEIEQMKQQIYKKRKPLQEYLLMLERHNFTIEKIIHDKFEYVFADGTAMLNHFFIKLAFLDGWKSIIPAARQTEIFKRIEYLMNLQADIEGFFKLSVPFVLIDCTKS